jgi:HAL2 family 3'(2'),5'-bisphosphate nucleotidase
MNEFQAELDAALACVREAARACQSVQSQITPEVLAKKDRSPVTVADYASQAIICERLRQAFPRDPIIAEEDSASLASADRRLLDQITAEVRKVHPSATDSRVCEWIDRGCANSFSDRFWTLDPLDGTKGFLRGQQYAISLALIVRGRIRVGVLGCPNLPLHPGGTELGALFGATHEHGAFAESLHSLGPQSRLHVSTTGEAKSAIFCESVESEHSSHSTAATISRNLGMTRSPVRMDSQAKYAVVARGEADIYMRLPTRADYEEKIWDHAAGVLILLEAGGAVSDIDGVALDFTRGRTLSANRGILATNGKLHSALAAELARAMRG